MADAFDRVVKMSERLTTMRTTALDLADRAGFSPAATDEVKLNLAKVLLMTKESQVVAAELRSNLDLLDQIDAANKASQTSVDNGDAELERINKSSSEVLAWLIREQPSALSILQMYGSKLPQPLADEIQLASGRIPDSMPLDSVVQADHLLREKVSKLQDDLKRLEQEQHDHEVRARELEAELAESKASAKVESMGLRIQLQRSQDREQRPLSSLRLSNDSSEQLEASLSDLKLKLADAHELPDAIRARVQAETKAIELKSLVERSEQVQADLQIDVQELQATLEAEKRKASEAQSALVAERQKAEALADEQAAALRQHGEMAESTRSVFTEELDNLMSQLSHLQGDERDARDLKYLLSQAVERIEERQRKTQIRWANLWDFVFGPLGVDSGDKLVQRVFTSNERAASQEHWQQPWQLMRSWSSCSRSIDRKRHLHTIVLDVLAHQRHGVWDEASGAFDTLRELQEILNDPSVTNVLITVAKFIVDLLSRAVESESSTLMVKIAACQILWLVADRWPEAADLSFQDKASEGILVLCRKRDLEGLPETFAAHKRFEDVVLVCPNQCTGALIVQARTLRWVAQTGIKFCILDASITLSPPEDIPDVPIRLPIEDDWDWFCQQIPPLE